MGKVCRLESACRAFGLPLCWMSAGWMSGERGNGLLKALRLFLLSAFDV